MDFSRVASHVGEELKLRKRLTRDHIVMVVVAVTHGGDVLLSNSVGISHHLTLPNTHSLGASCHLPLRQTRSSEATGMSSSGVTQPGSDACTAFLTLLCLPLPLISIEDAIRTQIFYSEVLALSPVL